jgi:arylformamidase
MLKVLYDISRPLRAGFPVWPGDPPFQIEWSSRIADGAGFNLSTLQLSPHTGTHADAPYHVAEDGARIGGSPLDAFLGPVRVVDAAGWASLSRSRIQPILQAGPVERVLFHTGCWPGTQGFPKDFASIDPQAAAFLVDIGVRLVGTDAPSVDAFDTDDLPVHHLLRQGGVQTLESLLLDGVPPGDYQLIALPLRLDEAEASPVRAVLCALP